MKAVWKGSLKCIPVTIAIKMVTAVVLTAKALKGSISNINIFKFGLSREEAL